MELPESLIKEEVNTMLQETAAQMAQQGMDVKKLFTPDTVKNLAEASGKVTERLQRSLALKALAKAEDIKVSDADIDAKVKEVSQGFSDTNRIDPARLRSAVAEDLLRDTLLEWLEKNSSVTLVDPKPEGEEAAVSEGKPKPKAKAKTKAKAKAKANADESGAVETTETSAD